MNRRNFLKSSLLTLVMAYSPISLKPQDQTLTKSDTITILDGILRKVYEPISRKS